MPRWDCRPARSPSSTSRSRFPARPATYANVVILAGDVHFAGSYACDYQRSGAAPSRIVQLISSATRNEWPWFVEALFSQHQWTRVIQRLGTPATYAGWNDPIP